MTDFNLDSKINAETFDGQSYLEKYNDVAEARLDPYSHFVNNGFWEGRVGTFFDKEWYRARHDDVYNANLDEFEHYNKHGRAEDREASFISIARSLTGH